MSIFRGRQPQTGLQKKTSRIASVVMLPRGTVQEMRHRRYGRTHGIYSPPGRGHEELGQAPSKNGFSIPRSEKRNMVSSP